MTIGNRIATLRKNLQLSQEEMADKLGVSRQAVSKWETDASAPDAFNLIALSELLNASVENIVTGKIENKTTNNQSNETLKNLSIFGYILAIGGIIMSFIGMFLHFIWCIIGAFIVATGFIFGNCNFNRNSSFTAYPLTLYNYKYLKVIEILSLFYFKFDFFTLLWYTIVDNF